MLQLETLDNLKGFSNSKDGYYYSDGFRSGIFGLDSNISIVAETITGTHGFFNWFAYKGGDLNPGMYALDDAGRLFLRTGSTWASAHTYSSNGNGLIGFKQSELLYASDRYMGNYDGLTFTDTYKDFSNTVSGTTDHFRASDTFEDWIVFANREDIAVYNQNDFSFTAKALELPLDFYVRAVSANQNGLLIGANYLGKSVLFLWDVVSLRSLTGWMWFDSEIQSICRYQDKWIVTLTDRQIITNGYSSTDLPLIPDSEERKENFSVLPSGTLVIDNFLYTANTATQYNRLKSGVYIQDLESGLFQFVPVANKCTVGVTMGALYKDVNSNELFVSYASTLPSEKYIGRLVKSSSTSATLITSQLGTGPDEKVAQGLKVDLSTVPTITSLDAGGTFKASLKIYNFKRQLWAYGVTNSASANTTTLKVDGSLAGYNNAQVGDEVTITSGANAGLVRHITAIANAGTNTEVWTLDSALTSNTESGAAFNVQPFQLVKTKTITISNLGELESIYFDIRNRIRGRKFLAKLVLSDISGISLSVPSLTFIYEDLGVI